MDNLITPQNGRLYVCMCVHVYVCMCICVYVCVCVCVCVSNREKVAREVGVGGLFIHYHTELLSVV